MPWGHHAIKVKGGSRLLFCAVKLVRDLLPE